MKNILKGLGAGVALLALSTTAGAQLLGVSAVSNPTVVMSNNGTYSYTYNSGSGQGVFAANLDPDRARFDKSGFPPTYLTDVNTDASCPGRYADVQLTLDGSGNFVSGASGDDFVLCGSVDTDNDGIDDAQGVLLTGEVVAFGFANASLDLFDMRIKVTGGALASFYVDDDLSLRLEPENSDFNGNFNQDFSGTFVKGNVGGTPSLCVGLEKQISIDGGVTWADADNFGDVDMPSVPVAASATIEYQLIATNCGSVDLVDLYLNDSVLGVTDHYVASLAAGASVTLTKAEIGQLDTPDRCANPGTKTNSASVNADSSTTAESVSDSDTAVIQCNAVPAIRLIKQISTDGTNWYDADTVADAPPAVIAPHEAHYRFIVENVGTAPLYNVQLSDNDLNALFQQIINHNPLQPGEVVVVASQSSHFPADTPVADRYINPGASVNPRCTSAGTQTNVATVVGLPDANEPGVYVIDTDPANMVCIDDGTPALVLLKQISVDGSPWADADTQGSGPFALWPSDASYRLIVRNVGDVTLTNVKVNDAALGIVDFPLADLAPGAEVILDQGDIGALYQALRCNSGGHFGNTASVEGTNVNNAAETVSVSNDAWMECDGTPAVKIEKEISTNGIDWLPADTVATAPSEPINSPAEYRMIVTNIGDVPLVNVVVTDGDLFPSLPPLSYPVPGTLNPGDSVTVGAGEIPELDVAVRCDHAGTFSNIASVDATAGDDGIAVHDENAANLVCIGDPSVTLLKEISVDGGTTWADAKQVGDADVPTVAYPHDAEYRLTVYNTGNIPLTNVRVTDSSLNINGETVSGTIAVGGSMVIGSGEINSLMVTDRCSNYGTLVNSAKVEADGEDSAGTTVNAVDTAVINCIDEPHITIIKQVSLDNSNWADADNAGDSDVPTVDAPSHAYYRFIVTNDGNVDLTNVTINDNDLGIVNYLVGDLAKGASVTIDDGVIGDLYEAERCAGAGTYTNVVDVEGSSIESGETVVDSDPAVLICTDEPPPGECLVDVEVIAEFDGTPMPTDCGDCDGKISALTLRHNSDSTAYIVVTMKDGTVVFSDTVEANATFSFVGADSKGTLGTEISISVDGTLATQIHTSCSQDVFVGMDFGPFTVIAGESRNGGELCPVAGNGNPTCDDVTYTYTLTNNGDPVDILAVNDDTYNLDIAVPFSMATGDTEEFVHEACVADDTTNSVSVEASLANNGTVQCGDDASTTVYCEDKEVWVQHCTNSSSGGQQCSLVKEMQRVCSDTPPPPPPSCHWEDVWVQHCTNSSSGGQQCSLVKEKKWVCDDDTPPPPPPSCHTEYEWVQHCTNSSSGGQQCSLVKEEKQVCDDDTPPPPAECGECDGKISALTLRYNGASDAVISVVQKKNGSVAFDGSVGAGEEFSFTGQDDKGTLSTEISLYVDGALATTIHTSCSQEVLPGMDFGPFTVITGASRNGGAFCPVQ